MLTQHLLSLLIWVPILGALFLLLLELAKIRPSVIKRVGLGISLLALGLCIPLYLGFDASNYQMQWVENYTWMGALNVHYALGVDGISVLFILLTCFTNLVMVLSVWQHAKEKIAQHLALFLLATGITNGVFAAQDALLYYVFWEASMLPIYLGLGLWGAEHRNYAALKFFLFNFLGSLMMLLAFVYLYFQEGSFSFSAWQNLHLSALAENWIFLSFVAAFATKMPMWPLHTWFADIHEQAPPGGSIVLGALMLKLGAYGFLRLNLPLTAGVSQNLVALLIILALVAIVYVGLASIAQKDMKRLIAYSSISHMGIATLGIFMVLLLIGHNLQSTTFTSHSAALLSLQGAVFQMVSHAFASGALFIMVAMLYERFRSNKIEHVEGLAKTMPHFAVFFVLFALANVGLPGTTGFVGEFLVLLAAVQGSFWVAFMAAFTLVLSPAYMLWWVKRSIFGTAPETNVKIKDIAPLEIFTLTLLAVPVVLLGIYPEPLLHLSYAANAHLVDLAAQKVAIGAYTSNLF